MFVLVLLIIFSFRSGSPPGADPGAESPCLVRAAYRNPVCQRANNSPLRTHEDWGKKNAIAPFNTGPVPLPDGTKQHGEPTKLPSDPRSREDTANGVGCLIQNGQTAASVSGSDPSPESTWKEQPAHAGIGSRPREEKSPRTHEKDDFCGQKSQKFAVNDSKSSPLFIHTGIQHRGKFKFNGTTFCRYLLVILSSLLEDGYSCMNTKYVEESDDARKYEYALKWKIHDTLSRLGSSENTFTQVYVYDLKKTHHYDHHNTFWDRAGPQQNNNSHCLKQFYDSLNDEYQKFYSGTRRSLGS